MDTPLQSRAGTSSSSCPTPAESTERADMTARACSSAAAGEPRTRHTPRRSHTTTTTTPWSTTAWLALLTIALLASPCAARPRNLNQGKFGTVATALSSRPELAGFVGLLTKANLLDFVNSMTSGTIFAPINATTPNQAKNQFNTNQLNDELLVSLLKYHMVPDVTITRTALTNGQHGRLLTTAINQALVVDRLTAGRPIVRGFNSAATYFPSSTSMIKVGNVYIHIVSSLLYPYTGALPGCSTTMDLIAKLGRTDFFRLVTYAGLEGIVNAQTTVLVPSNAKLKLKKGMTQATASAMVNAYLLGEDRIWTKTLMYQNQVLTAKDGSTFTVSQKQGALRLRRSQGDKPRIVNLPSSYLACTAAVYPIDAVLH